MSTAKPPHGAASARDPSPRPTSCHAAATTRSPGSSNKRAATRERETFCAFCASRRNVAKTLVRSSTKQATATLPSSGPSKIRYAETERSPSRSRPRSRSPSGASARSERCTRARSARVDSKTRGARGGRRGARRTRLDARAVGGDRGEAQRPGLGRVRRRHEHGVARGDASDDGAGGAVHHARHRAVFRARDARERQELATLVNTRVRAFLFPPPTPTRRRRSRPPRSRRPAAARAPPLRLARRRRRQGATPRRLGALRKRHGPDARVVAEIEDARARGAAVSPTPPQASRRALPRRGRAARARAKKSPPPPMPAPPAFPLAKNAVNESLDAPRVSRTRASAAAHAATRACVGCAASATRCAAGAERERVVRRRRRRDHPPSRSRDRLATPTKRPSGTVTRNVLRTQNADCVIRFVSPTSVATPRAIR